MMRNGKRYTNDFEEMIINLYKSGISIKDIGKEYDIARSTLYGWFNDSKEVRVRVSETETITAKEMKALKKEMDKIKEENEISKKSMVIFGTKN